jgi:hypothetical protein
LLWTVQMDTAHKLSPSFCLILGTNFYFFRKYRVLRKTLPRLSVRHPATLFWVSRSGWEPLLYTRLCHWCFGGCTTLPFKAMLQVRKSASEESSDIARTQTEWRTICRHLCMRTPYYAPSHTMRWENFQQRPNNPPCNSARKTALHETCCLPNTECHGCWLDGRIPCNRFCHANVPWLYVITVLCRTLMVSELSSCWIYEEETPTTETVVVVKAVVVVVPQLCI